jgi:hypothetical protein
MDAPDYAVINTLVELIKKLGKRELAGFINAVLRRVNEVKLPPLESNKVKDLAVNYSCPEWIVKLLVANYGTHFAKKYLSAEMPEKTHIRANLNAITADELIKLLPSADKSEYGLLGGRDHSYYWPKNGSLVFAGYSPDPTTFSSASQEYDLEKGLTIKGFVQSTDTKNTKDLMWFNHTKSSYREVNKVPVKFIHACSWLTFYVSSDTKDANFHIKKLVLNSVKTKADFTGNVPTWKFYDDASYVKDLVVFDSNNNNEIPYGGDPMRIDDEGVIVIPQDCVQATITYTMNNGAGVEIEQTETFQLSAGADNDIWKYSRHYIYKIIFSASEILIEPAVNDWIDVTGTEVEVN